MRRPVFTVLATAAAALALHGCAGRPPSYDSLYDRLIEEHAPADPGVLAGRRIVIDPGHGGAFDGAVGADSLTEAEVNLGVALYLWGLLEEAGAEVLLTRTTDRDFLPDSTAETADDLAARIDRANAFSPEVFLSIHHNASAERDRDRNAVEIYYRADDPFASLELAVDLHTHLARNLGIGQSGIGPGTYYVLRRSTAGAAVLGEASYLSHPPVEERLKLAAKQRLEAEAYYLGLVEYFSRGVPVIERVAPAADTMISPGTILCRVSPGAGVPVDPSSIAAAVGGRRLAPALLPGDLAALVLPADLDNGTHEIFVTARSVGGATARLGPSRIVIDRPAAFILPLPLRMQGAEQPIEQPVLVLDRDGRPVADGTPVSAEGPEGRRLQASTRGGTALIAVTRDAAGPWLVMSGCASLGIDIADANPEGGPVLHAVDARSGAPVGAAAASREGGAPVRADDRGVIRLESPLAAPLTVKATGYRYRFVDAASRPDTVMLEPLFGGALRAARISIDPCGGGPEDAGRGSGRLRGASVNLSLARILARALEAGGAAVLITRGGEEPLSPHERVFRVNAFGAGMALQLCCGVAPGRDSCAVLHYPGSARGRALADSIARASILIPPCGGVDVRSAAEIFLQQTACPAVSFVAGSLEEGRTEELFGSPRWLRLQSQALLRGILAWSCPGRYAPVDIAVRVLSADRAPVGGAAVTIDDAVTLLTGDDGTAVFTCFEAGEHGLLIAPPGGGRILRRIVTGPGAIECVLP